MASYTREFTIQVIEQYRDLPCLWLTTDPDYHDKSKRKKALDKLVEFYESQHQVATREIVNKKLHSLRGAYRKELNKVKASQKLGSEDVHVPKLWYFHLLTFLEDQDISKRSEDTCDVEQSDDSQSHTSGDKTRESTPSISESGFKRRRSKVDNILSKISKRLDSPPRVPSVLPTKQYDAFGLYIAEQLRSIPPPMLPICKKLINDVIFLAETRLLNNTSRVTTATM